MSIELLSEFIREKYEVYEWKHACAILKEDFANEWNEIISVLESFRLKKSWITTSGGKKSKVSAYIDGYLIDGYLYDRDWVEKEFETKVTVDDHTMDTPTHKIDCFKNRVALEIEWNNKAPFYDRDQQFQITF